MDATNPVYIPRNHLVEAAPGRQAYAHAAQAEFTEGCQTFCGT